MPSVDRLAAGAPHRSAWLVALAVAGLVAAAQAQQPRVFRAEVDVVPIDLVVLDREGRPVSGLAVQNFQVTVDGQPRKVVSAQFLSSASAPSAPRTTAPRATRFDVDEAFDTVYVGNDRAAGSGPAPARRVIIAIDQSSFATATGRSAATAARGLLDLLHPNDRVGLAVFPPPGPNLRPTLDHQRIRLALGQVTGGSESFPRTELMLTVSDALAWQGGDTLTRAQVMQRACSVLSVDTCRQDLESSVTQVVQYAQRQSQTTLRALSDVIRAASIEGGPTAIVLVSGGLFGGGSAPQLGVDEEMRAVARLAAASRATLYGIYSESGFLDRDSMERSRVAGFSTADGELRLGGLRHLAGLCGGTVTRVTSGSDVGFRRVSLELSAYYLLGIESGPSDRDGQRHRIRVQVDRPGLTVRSREELYLPATRNLSADEAVQEALKGTQIEGDLPIRLSTQMMREAGDDNVRLLVSAYIGRDVTSPAQIRVGYSIRGAGAAATRATSEVQSRTLPVVGSGSDATLCYIETVSLTPGRYLLRLAAVDAAGRVGSVQQPLDAMLVGGEGLAFSDLLLVDPRRTLENTFAPAADGRMTVDALEAFVEIYPQGVQQVGSVVFEVADMPGGPALVGGSVVPERKDSNRLTAGITLELGALPAGSYTLNARVLDGERVLGRLSRPFRLEPLTRRRGAIEPRAAFGFAASGGVLQDFAPGDALAAEAVDYFVGRMRATETVPAGEAVTSATEAVRSSRFGAAVASLADQPSDVLSVAFLRGLALFGQGQLEPAAAQFRAALRISNDFLPAAFYLGACYAAGGRDREAVGAWQTSLVSETGSRMIYEVLADALLRLKDGPQAEAIIAEAQGRWPDDDVFAPRLAAARVILNRRDEALAALMPYIERHPADPEPLFLAIRLLYEAHGTGKPIKNATTDRDLARKYAALYAQTAGAKQALVARWVASMSKD
jgi:VWFA-related protein